MFLAPGEYEFSLDFETIGSWDSEGGCEDKLTVNLFTGSSCYRSVLADLQGPKAYTETLEFVTSGLVSIMIGSQVTDLPNETWNFVSAEISATPLPGAVFLLGSGLLGLVGVRRLSSSSKL